MGAPHCGHAALVEVMLDIERGACVVLVGSADVADRPDTPLPWESRRELLLALLRKRGAAVQRITFAPLPELKTNGWDARWCAYLLDAARTATATGAASGGEPPHLARYVFGDDYEASVFAALTAQAPSLELVRAARRYDKSSRELRVAIAHGEAQLLEKYEAELDVYGAEVRERIARVCAHGVDRSDSPASP
jgi:hypothetical protein